MAETLTNAKPFIRIDVVNWMLEMADPGHRRVRHYLEIGVADGVHLAHVEAEVRIGVDPNMSPCACRMPSDKFWTLVSPISGIKFDVIFIDGDHRAEQVWRDIQNAAGRLRPGGYIVLHDCSPPTWMHGAPEPYVKGGLWNGTVWWAMTQALASGAFEGCTVDTDWGCGVLRPVDGNRILYDPDIPDFAEFDTHREEWLGLISVDEFKARYERYTKEK